MSELNYIGQEGIDKLKELAEGIDFCMFCSGLSLRPINATPMSVQEVDDNGDIWFLGSKSSDKYTDILQDGNVQLFFSKNSDFTYLSVYGTGSFSEDQARIDKYWNKMVEGWFEKGREDPDIVLIKIMPHDIRYWETKDNKIVSLAKVLWTSVTGDKTDAGREGNIEI
jgi:general stress protein 26